MDELRHLVVDVNHDGQPRQGFELGRIYAGLRGVVPIFSFSDPEKQVGALEVGTSFSTLIDSISTAIGSDVAILIRDERVDDAVWNLPEKAFRSECGCFIEASSSDDLKEVITALESKRKHQPDSEERTTLLETTVASRTRDIQMLNTRLEEMANKNVLTGVWTWITSKKLTTVGAIWQATQCLQIWAASCRSRPETMMLLAAMAVRSSRF